MLGLNSRSATRKRKRNEKPKSRSRRLISQEKSRSANVQYPAARFLKLTRVTFAKIHRQIESLANSSSAKRSSAAKFRKNRRKSFSLPGKPTFLRASFRNEEGPSRHT